MASLYSIAWSPSAHAQDTGPIEASTEIQSSSAEDAAISRTEAIVLWQGLEAGMSPEHALPIIQEMSGIKRARLYRSRSSENPDQIKISYTSGKIQIGDMEFVLRPRFAKKRLDQVWLAAGDQCSKDAILVFDRLSAGLSSKYPEAIFQNEMRESDIARANLDALRSGEKVAISHIYGSKEVVVLLTFAFSTESPPPHPGYRSKFALAAYQIARTNYDNRLRQCSGTGTKRMDIALQYMTRKNFDAEAAQTGEEIETGHQELVDQL